jgi:hypothetical protein
MVGKIYVVTGLYGGWLVELLSAVGYTLSLRTLAGAAGICCHIEFSGCIQ